MDSEKINKKLTQNKKHIKDRQMVTVDKNKIPLDVPHSVCEDKLENILSMKIRRYGSHRALATSCTDYRGATCLASVENETRWGKVTQVGFS